MSNLIEQAEADLEMTLEDTECGFGVALFFKDDQDADQQINCQTTDIGFFIDMSTGAGTITRNAEITARLSTLKMKNIPEIDRNVFIKYITTAGDEYKMKVTQPMYDRKIGLVRMSVEVAK
jgi:hypothetical protein